MVEGKTVTVDVLEDHTYDGILHTVGTQYEAEEGHVDFLLLRGFARPATVPAATAPTKSPAKP